MLREAHIPLILWLPAALLMHFAGGEGAVEAAKTLSGRAAILAFSRSVRRDVRSSLRGELSIEVIDDSGETLAPKPAETTARHDDSDDGDESTERLPPRPKIAAASKPPVAKPKPKKPAPITPPAARPVARATPKVAAPPKAAAPSPRKPPKTPPQQVMLPKPAGRIAVINDPALNRHQADNPQAQRIAEFANHTKAETMARYRSYDQNASKPTGGGDPERADPSLSEPGNDTETARGHSIENDDPGAVRPGSEHGPREPPSEPVARSLGGSNQPQSARRAVAGQRGRKTREAGLGPLPPGTSAGRAGSWSISPDGGDGRKAQAGRKGRRAIAARKGHAGRVGLTGIPTRYSINAYGLQEALGARYLRAEQERARHTRLARHRGRFKGNQFQKYRAAIENYDPSVKLGNQTSLNAARVPFAAYINRMHNRIHPIFADGFLGSLSTLGADQQLSDMKLFSHVELVLNGQTGAITRAGIVKPSGVTAFDVGALSSLEAAGPFGKPPDSIISPDGNVYLHWEFYRNPYYACTSRFARPYLIRGTSPASPGAAPPRPPGSPPEGARYGARGPLRPLRTGAK